jgi:hypothetical protein
VLPLSRERTSVRTSFDWLRVAPVVSAWERSWVPVCGLRRVVLESEEDCDEALEPEDWPVVFWFVETWAKAVLLSSRRAAPRAIFFMELSPIKQKVRIKRTPYL